MAITDFIWPFEKKFSQIPCAREAAIFGILGGPMIGALGLIYDKKPLLAYKRSVAMGFVFFWAAFITCRYQNANKAHITEQFKDALSSGKLD